MASNKKQLSINMVANIASYSTNIIITFFLTPYLIQVLGKEAYSFYPIANNFVQYMSIVTIALNSMASRFITIELARKNIDKANNYFSSVLFSNFILSGILLIPMTLTIVYLEKILNIPEMLVPSIKVLFILVFLTMIVNVVTSVFNIATFARNRIDLRSLVDIIHAVLKMILYIVLFCMFKPSIIFVGLISMILSVVVFFVNYMYTKKLLPEVNISFGFFDIECVREILFSGVWNSVNQIGSALMFSLSIVYCNVLIGTSAGGEYSIIQTIPNFLNGIISTLSSVFMPIMVNMYATKPITRVIEEVRFSQKIMGIITNIPIVVFMVVGADFYRLWVPDENANRLHILSIMVVVHLLFIGVTWTISNLNTVINKVKIPALFLIGCGVFNFIAVMFLTKYTSLGIYAIPLSSMVILIVWAGVFIPIYPCKVLELPWNTFYKAIYKMIISSSCLLIFSIFLYRFVVLDTWFKLFSFCVFVGIIGLIFNMFLILNKSEKRLIIGKVINIRSNVNENKRT